jgi:hypothetical protein
MTEESIYIKGKNERQEIERSNGTLKQRKN